MPSVTGGDNMDDSYGSNIDMLGCDTITKIVDVYAVYTDIGSDVTTVKGKLVGIYLDKEDADEVKAGHGWHGGSGIVEEAKALKLRNGTFYLLAHSTPLHAGINMARAEREQRKAALAKLTEHEKKLLNIKE